MLHSEYMLEQIRPLFLQTGISRLANITGLDRIGIPVSVAVRPNSVGLASSAGKGLALHEAYLSAAMEALERYSAEESTPSIFRAAYGDLGADWSLIPIEKLPLRKYCSFSPDWPHDWMGSWDILNDCKVAVPLTMVNLSGRHKPYDFPLFQASSVGLAAGADLLEAILEGLLEVVEHDAITCFRYGDPDQSAGVTAIESFRDLSPELGQIVESTERAGLKAVVRDCTSDVGIPVYEAILFDQKHLSLGLFYGSAAALNTVSALTKAILEAVQSRTVYIAGARDDYFSRNMKLSRMMAQNAYATLGGGHFRVGSFQLSDYVTSTVHDDIGAICDALRTVGVRQALVSQLSPDDWPAKVVKVIVPLLECPIRDGYRPGSRALTSRRQQ